MTLDQRRAFGLWYSKVMPPSTITRGHQSLIRDTGNLIAYLPFHNFQHFSPAQVTALWALTPGRVTWEARTLSVRLAPGHKKWSTESTDSLFFLCHHQCVSYACSWCSITKDRNAWIKNDLKAKGSLTFQRPSMNLKESFKGIVWYFGKYTDLLFQLELSIWEELYNSHVCLVNMRL